MPAGTTWLGLHGSRRVQGDYESMYTKLATQKLVQLFSWEPSAFLQNRSPPNKGPVPFCDPSYLEYRHVDCRSVFKLAY